MNQSSEYLDFILDKFAALEVVTARKMFGGYVLHMAGKVLGFVYIAIWHRNLMSMTGILLQVP